jgi:sugar diacid utilization regulator/GAF domain-containing protein
MIDQVPGDPPPTDPAARDREPAALPGAGPEAGLEAALAGAFLAAGPSALVGLVAGGLVAGPRSDHVRYPTSLSPAVADELCRGTAGLADGVLGSVPDGQGTTWTGFRYAIDATRAAVALVPSTALDEITALRLAAIALGLARTALMVEGRRRDDQLNQLLTTARRVAESLELETVLASIVEDATTLLGADSGDMLLWDRERDALRVVAVANLPPDMIGFELGFGEGISSQAIAAQHPIEVARYAAYEHRAPALDRYDFGAVLCAPLVFRGDAIGAINVHAPAGAGRFLPGAADLLAAFAGHAAIAIDHARRYENEVRLGRVLADTNRDLSRSLSVQQQLAEQVILDAGPAGIATVLAEHLGRRVVIQDHLHRLIAGASPDGGDGWRRLVPGSPGDPGGDPERDPFAIVVRVGRDVVGHLLISSDADLGPIDRALVDVATTGVALEFAKERAAAEVEESLRGEAAADLLTGSYASEAAIAARAARLGYDLGEPMDLLVVDAGSSADQGSTGDHERLRRGVLLIRERFGSRGRRSLAFAHAGLIVVLDAAGRTSDRDAREVAADLKAALEAGLGDGPVTIAVGDRCRRPNDYAPAFGLARDALELMERLGRQGTIVVAGELGTYGLLLRASSRIDLESFARRLLHPIMEHDRAHGGDLLATLRAYIDEDRVQRRVAERCFIHVNTVVYRIRRIEALLGVDLGDPATVFDITLAFRVLDLLDDAAPTGVASARAAASPARPA